MYNVTAFHVLPVFMYYMAIGKTSLNYTILYYTKLHCSGSTFASNYRHLSYKYNICEEDWFSGLSHLLGKVKMRFAEINKSCTYSTQALIELCGIRDGTIQCNILNQNEACALIDVLRTEYDFCMILNCIYCIIYCCIYYVCNNLVVLLKLVQYVRLKKYLFISKSHPTCTPVATCQRKPCLFSVCNLLTILYINSHLFYIYYYVSASVFADFYLLY